MRRVAEATRGLASSTADPPLVPVEGPRELALLAESFNEVAVALAKAREAERAFLLSVSHELKTPLTAIRGYAEGLGEGALPAEEAAATILRESQRLERLVGDLLDLGRMHKAEFSVRREPIDLDAIAQEALRRYEGQAQDFGVTLEAAARSPAPAIGDADRTLQIISNLVENALRLTPAGGSVRIVPRRARSASRTQAPASVPRSSSGRSTASTSTPAMDASARSGRASGWRSSRSSREGMGGSVSAESTPGQLTVFTVRLPRAGPLHSPARGRSCSRLIGFTPVLRWANGRLTAPGKDAASVSLSGGISDEERQVSRSERSHCLPRSSLATTAVPCGRRDQGNAS